MTEPGGELPTGRLVDCTSFGKRPREETENKPTKDPDGREKSNRKKFRSAEKKGKNGSSSDTPSSDVTGLSTPVQRNYTPPPRSSSVGSVSNNPSLPDGGYMGVTRDLSKELNEEGGVFVMKPEVSPTLKHLRRMSKKNPELKVGLEMFTSAVKFVKTILLVKERTEDVKPSSS